MFVVFCHKTPIVSITNSILESSFSSAESSHNRDDDDDDDVLFFSAWVLRLECSVW